MNLCSVTSVYTIYSFLFFFLSSIRRHTRCALVTGFQTCALPISSSTSCTLRAGASVSRPILSNIGVLRPIYPAGGLSRRRGSKTAPARIAGRGQHRDEASVHRLARPDELVRSVLRRRHHVVLASLDLPQHHRLGDAVAGLRALDRAVKGLHTKPRKGLAHLHVVCGVHLFQ